MAASAKAYHAAEAVGGPGGIGRWRGGAERLALQRKEKGPDPKIEPFCFEFIPAATYVPTQLPVQYHRPGEA
jgi:hypothetical protein